MLTTTLPDRGVPQETPSEDRRGGEAGFSLVELLVVLAIIGMIATMVTPQVLGYLGRAKGETARIQVKNIAQAVELYYLDLGAYPTSQQGLQALVQPSGPGWRGPYVRDARGLTDPWGHAYLYRSPAPPGRRSRSTAWGPTARPAGPATRPTWRATDPGPAPRRRLPAP